MVSPHPPGGQAVGQAILDDGVHGKANHLVSVATAGSGKVGGIGQEIFLAGGAIMLRNRELNNLRASRLSDLVELSGESSLAPGLSFAPRTLAALEIAAALDNSRPRQLFRPHNSFGGIGGVSSRSQHGMSPLSDSVFQQGVYRQL